MANESIYLLHLQFVDDTLFFCSSKERSFVNLNGFLSFFEDIVGLKIYKGKSMITGLNCDPSKFDLWGL